MYENVTMDIIKYDYATCRHVASSKNLSIHTQRWRPLKFEGLTVVRFLRQCELLFTENSNLSPRYILSSS